MDIVSNNKAIMLKVMDQLVQGHELATKLQQLLSQHGSGRGAAGDLVAKISASFSDTISDLDSFEPIPSSLFTAVEGSQNASCNNDGKLEDSVDSRKRFGPVKGKRGCYKRKSYFRCTHKYTQGCKATKQVQKLELEPRMFSITYIGNHTCDTDEVTPNINPCVHHDDGIMDSEEFKCPSLRTSMNEEEDNHHHGLSTESDLQLVWQEMLVFGEEHNHHHHEAIYGCGETSASIYGLDTTDLWSWQRFPVQR
ncbi:hypothetical protein IGI04_014423 [Brassica rapa subsp. trilocularis]|uniref:WRKY domain-containing protein n=1 Tax=Brassica rapa subsp. trilocularis TaxID=1813537 RepID=A0ABQ7MQD2_BRACM|nr:hypothetical protein IGI04_014423 [Brassica rapa subsp. trilocularis]